jgi:hypothetical protein
MQRVQDPRTVVGLVAVVRQLGRARGRLADHQDMLGGVPQESSGEPAGPGQRAPDRGAGIPMIVKLQRPLYSRELDPPALVYDRRRTRHWMVPMSADRAQALLGDAPKGYFEAKIVNGNLVLGERVPDQQW